MKAVTIDKVAGQPREFEVAGQTFKMSQITVGILAQVETWARTLPYVRLKEKLAMLSDAPKDQKAEWYKQADKEALDASLLQRELSSMNGVLFMVRKCFEACQPDLTDEVFQLITNSVGMDVLEDFMDKDNTIPGFDEEQQSEKKSPESK